MNPETIVVGIMTLVGGAFGAAVINGIVSHRKGVRDADLTREQNALEGFKTLTEDLRKEVDRLKLAREEDRARLDRIEDQIKIERDLKWLAIQHLRALYAWISQRMPGEQPPPVPEDLAAHVIIPSRKDTP